jgi:hypothetical protein
LGKRIFSHALSLGKRRNDYSGESDFLLHVVISLEEPLFQNIGSVKLATLQQVFEFPPETGDGGRIDDRG